MRGAVDFKEEQRLIGEAEQGAVKRPTLSAVPTARTQPQAQPAEPIWGEGETRVGTNPEGEFILENTVIPSSSASGKKTKLIVALALTIIGFGGVAYFKLFRPTTTYNSVALSGPTETKSAPVEPVFNPLTSGTETAVATPAPTKPVEAVITELAVPESSGASSSATDKTVVAPVETNAEAVTLQAAEVKQLRVDLTSLEASVNTLKEQIARVDAPKPLQARVPRVVKKPVQPLNPDAVTKAATRPAKPESNTPAAIIEESAGTRDESSPTVLGVDIWDGKPSVVVGTANKGKTSYKVYAAGDRVDGMELRQADPITGTVVFNVGGNNVRVKADNQPSTSKAVQSVTTGVQKP
jgi:hypothetical protein